MSPYYFCKNNLTTYTIMKKTVLMTLVMLLTAAISPATERKNIPTKGSAPIMKALPIYSNTLIDEAPAGETVSGIRDCYSQHMISGVSFRDKETGVIGEYVIGDDGNIYLKAPCYSAAKIDPEHLNTYLKLEKVDETTYVAHTPQLIWVDNSGDSPFTAYATRVVFSQKSATSFGYEVQQGEDGAYDTDIYFTLEDGKLMQSNMNTIEMNEEIFAEELIGFTTSTGGWIGFGDGCVQIYSPTEDATALPEGAETSEKSLAYTLLHVRDIELDNAALMKYAEVGDDIYLSNPSAKTEQWIKGTIDREKGTATFSKQFLGLDAESGYAIWFIPAIYEKYFELITEETGFGEWFRTYSPTDKLVLKYNNRVLTSDKGQAMYFSHSPEELLLTEVYADPSVKGYEAKSTTPAPVKFTKFESYDDLWGFAVIGFAIPSMNTEGEYIRTDELYYNVFADDNKEPFVFTPADYIDMKVDSMTDVPYGYFEDFDFKVSGINHTVYLYHDWKKVGVQVIQKHDGQETRSAIVYAGDTGAVDSIDADWDKSSRVRKHIENGNVIIERDGVKYNVLGIPVKK